MAYPQIRASNDFKVVDAMRAVLFLGLASHHRHAIFAASWDLALSAQPA